MPDIYMDVGINLSEVPVNLVPIVDKTDGFTIKDSIPYDADGMDMNWNFVTTSGEFTQTNVTPTSGGVHDWGNQNNGMYSLEIPASGGTINNNQPGFAWFSGVTSGEVLPSRGPTIGFRSVAINNAFIDEGDWLDKVADAVADETYDTDESGEISLRGAQRLMLSVLTGNSAGGGTSTLTFSTISGEKNRISATVDANGNRTAVGTRDAT